MSASPGVLSLRSLVVSHSHGCVTTEGLTGCICSTINVHIRCKCLVYQELQVHLDNIHKNRCNVFLIITLDMTNEADVSHH